MKPDTMLSLLRSYEPALDALAQGKGDPMALCATLLPDIAVERVRAAADGILPHTDPALTDLSLASAELRVPRFTFVTALARLADRGLLDPAWCDRVDDVLYDVLGRPRIYRDLSDAALSLLEGLDLAEGSISGRLCARTARAALDAPSPESLVWAKSQVRAARRADRVAAWTGWIADRTDALLQPLREALDTLAQAGAPLAASDGAPDAMARVVVGEALNGEVSVAISAHGILLEWDGDGDPPESCLQGHNLLDAVPEGSLAAAAWMLPAPSEGGMAWTLRRGTQAETVRWPSEA